MLKKCTVKDNYIINSRFIDGIPLFISVPSEGVNISNNILISKSFTNVPPPVVRINIQEDHKFNPQEEIGGRTIRERINTDTDITITNNKYEMDKKADFLNLQYKEKGEEKDEEPLEIDDKCIKYKIEDQKKLESETKLEDYKSREYTLPSQENVYYVYCMNSLANNIKDFLERQ